MAERPKKPYVPIEVFKKNRDWSSRVIHDMHHWQRPYSADVTPSKMTFGSVAMGTLSAAQTGTVRNTGYRPLRILSITAVGEFLVTHDAPLVLYPGETFDLSVIFKPRHIGLCSGGVYIDTGDAAGKEFIEFLGYGLDGEIPVPGDEPTISISDGVLEDVGEDVPTLSISDGVLEDVAGDVPTISIGDAIIEDYTASSVTASVESISFGSVDAGSSSSAKAITFTNAGAMTVTLTSLTFPNGFVRSGGTIAVGGTIAAGGSATIFVMFSPDVGGEFSGNMVALFDDESEVIISLSGSAEGAGYVYNWLSTSGNQIVDSVTNEIVRLKSANWFGFEGSLIPGMLWARAYKTITVDGVTHLGILEQFVQMGFNSIRIPLCQDITWPGRKIYGSNTFRADLNPDFVLEGAIIPPEQGGSVGSEHAITSIEMLDKIVDHAATLGLRIILDLHCLAINPSNVEGTKGKWYTTVTPSSPGQTNGVIGEERNEEQWIQALEFLATRYLTKKNVVGFDMINEPHNCTWDDDAMTGLPAAVERCAARVQAINPNLLIIVQGIGQYGGDSYWWGGQLAGVATRPVVLGVPNKLVYSPHDYGQSVGTQSWLSTVGNPVPNYPDNIYSVFRAAWGYIAEQSIAPIWLGEFGGKFGYDGNGVADPSQQNAVFERQWVSTLVRYLNGHTSGTGPATFTPQSFAFWSFNPESGDTGGLVCDDNITPQQEKLALIAPLLV